MNIRADGHAGGQHLVHAADGQHQPHPLRHRVRRPHGVQAAAGGLDVHPRARDRAFGHRRVPKRINLGWDEVRLPAPVFEGDTLYARSEVVEARPSRSRPAMGILKLRTTGFNQDSVAVIEFLRTVMVYRRGHTPEGFRPRRPA